MLNPPKVRTHTTYTDDDFTDWYPPLTKPVHVGVYQVETVGSEHINCCRGYQYWNGERWGSYDLNIASAYTNRMYPSIFQHHTWRGLKEKK